MVRVKGRHCKLRLDQIEVKPELQMRAGGLDPDHAADIAESIRRKRWKTTAENRVKIVCVEGVNYATDGFHTVEGHRLAHKREVPCNVVKGAWIDAVIAAAGANQGHLAKKLSPKDKRKAAERLIGELQLAGLSWSNTRIAEHVGLNRDTVAEIVGEDSGEEEEAPHEPRKKLGRDGRARKSAKSQRRQRADGQASVSATDSSDWRTLPLCEFLDVSDTAFGALHLNSIETAGELWDAMKAGQATGLSAGELKTSTALIDTMRRNSGETDGGEAGQGDEVFDWRVGENLVGQLARRVDAAVKAFPVLKGTTESIALHRLLREFDGMWKSLKRRHTRS